jgi:predicted AAA+ superfamily ATPase
MIKRQLFARIKENIFPEKAIIFYGSRHSGKTTLLNAQSDLSDTL